MDQENTRDIISDALNETYTFFGSEYEGKDLETIKAKLLILTGIGSFDFVLTECKNRSYESIQEVFSKLNEKESIRKKKGVYYTPSDVVGFIAENSIKAVYGKLGTDGLQVMDQNGIPYRSFCYRKLVLDPTCGAGEFLLAVLEKKFDLLDSHSENITSEKIRNVVKTIYGNDINNESVTISKLRLFICAVKRYGLKKCLDIADILNGNFFDRDFVSDTPDLDRTFDLIMGNPPYVEDGKSGLKLTKMYGNIYANVLMNSAKLLNERGALGFVIPLSYVATPRMKALRDELFEEISEQYILSYADRPDCLFASVHQKLCIMIGKKRSGKKKIFTCNYQYWYKTEREELFKRASAVKNSFVKDEYIPKIGNADDDAVYRKVISHKNRKMLIDLQSDGDECVYVNMRAAFWIKAFRQCHSGAEYKQFTFESSDAADYFFCLINSSLFWWYWICVSDCWHITKKELRGFFVPKITDHTEVSRLAAALEDKLEQTKVYVGTKQTEYEYKHRSCVDEIHRIDDYINNLYGLTDAEGQYIKNFAYRYRVSGGAE